MTRRHPSKTVGSADPATRRAVTVLVALVIGLAGCTSGDDGADSTVDDEVTETTATSADAESATDTTGEAADTVIHSADFETAPSGDWSVDRVSTTPVGDRGFLGEFGNDRVNLTLVDLAPHQAITVAFDLFVLGSWDSGTERPDRWRLRVDGYRLIDTTFSNDQAEQAFPDNYPLALNPARTAAVETDSLGYTGASPDDPADSVYRIERTFLHDRDAIDIAFSAAGLGDLADESWGLDNVEVIAHQLSDRDPAVELNVDVVDANASVTGTVGSDSERELVEQSLAFHFRDRVAGVDLAVGDGPSPLWLLAVDDVTEALAPYGNVSLAVDERAATASGEVRTYRWREQLTERLTAALGVDVATAVELDVTIDDALVDQVEGLRVEFPTGSTELDAADQEVLVELVGLLDSDDQLVVRVDGHTDSVGTVEDNKRLSRDRAVAVADFLVANGADRSQVLIAGFGVARPEVEELTDDDRATNRRVVFSIPRG